MVMLINTCLLIFAFILTNVNATINQDELLCKINTPYFQQDTNMGDIAYRCLRAIYVNVTSCNEQAGYYHYCNGNQYNSCQWLWSNIECTKIYAQVSCFCNNFIIH